MMEALTIAVGLTFFAAGWVSGCESQTNKTWFIESHLEKPYCIDESATVLRKTVHNKRCWKVVEVEP